MYHNLTEIVFLLDRSGSMAGLEQDTIGGFNSFIQQQKKMEGSLVVTTVLFDNKYELLWDGVSPEKAQLTHKEYFVRGTTALLDAIGKTILDVGRRHSKMGQYQRPDKVIFVITTDGMENASKEFTYSKIKEMIIHQQQRYNWEFIFLGANIDAFEEAENIGISRGNAINFTASKKGVEKLYCQVSESVSNKRHR